MESEEGKTMNRLTSNKSVLKMGMFELAHNSNYKKEGKARYRDYDSDIDARELARRLLKDYADGDDSFTDDEEFDDFMLDCLQDGIDSIEGVIALFYRNLWAMADLHEKLKKFEDLEEQGRLLELPCVVGDDVWYISERVEKQGRKKIEVPFVDHGTVDNITLGHMMIPQITVCNDENVWITFDNVEDFSKCVFRTKPEAERALVEIKERFK